MLNRQWPRRPSLSCNAPEDQGRKLKETVHGAKFYSFYNCTTTRPLSDQYLYLFASFTNLILRCCFLSEQPQTRLRQLGGYSHGYEKKKKKH